MRVESRLRKIEAKLKEKHDCEPLRIFWADDDDVPADAIRLLWPEEQGGADVDAL